MFASDFPCLIFAFHAQIIIKKKNPPTKPFFLKLFLDVGTYERRTEWVPIQFCLLLGLVLLGGNGRVVPLSEQPLHWLIAWST